MASDAREVESVKEEPPSQEIKEEQPDVEAPEIEEESLDVKSAVIDQENTENGVLNDALLEDDDLNTLLIQSDGGEVDLPNDFFDDFTNVDFLAGLDVVDAWEEEGQSGVPDLQPESTSNAPSVSNQDCAVENEEASKQIEESEQPEEHTKTSSKQVKQEEVEVGTNATAAEVKREKSVNSKYASEKKKSRSISGERSKNRDDMRRDPVKVKRDIQRSKEKCEKERIVAKLKMVETGLVPPGTEMDMPDTTETSKLCETSKESNQAQRSSKRPHSRSVSPLRRRRSRTRSPYHVRRPSPAPHRRRSRSKSPIATRYYASSWRKRHRSRSRSLSRSRDRSNAYRRKRSLSQQRKQTFLEEIKEKLGAQTHSEHSRSSILPTPQPPQPVPPPLMHQMVTMYPALPYDQSYYAAPGINPYAANMYNAPMACAAFDPYQHHEPVYPQTQVFPLSDTERSNEQLFNDPNITLTEFLSIRRRSTDTAQQLDSNVREKVIGRTQDALLIIKELSQPSGIFYCKVDLQKRRKNVQEKASKQKTPMRSGPTVNFRFATRQATEDRSQTPLLRLLQKMGIDELALHHRAAKRVGGEEMASGLSIQMADVEERATQTDEPACEECINRKKKRFVDVGIQCKPETESLGTQFNDEKMLNTARSALQNVLRNQSLSSFTPAQILGMNQDPRTVQHQQRSEFQRRIPQEQGAYDRRGDVFGRLDGFEVRPRGLLPNPQNNQQRHQFLNPPGFNSYGGGQSSSGSKYF